MSAGNIVTPERIPALYTAQEVASLLGLSTRRVRALAASRSLGRRIGPFWVFTAADVDGMRVRVPGRRRKTC